MNLVNSFQNGVATAVTVAMLQAGNVGDFSGVEVEIDICGFYRDPISYKFRINPPAEEDYDKEEVENAITAEVDSVYMDMMKDAG